ncbi:hypothetical protein [Pantoea sp. C2G6]|uniref:hypothetical protein n=1 Tax=Pantoea sp. C2G6 TaxID=3243084 RepID=UPI003ED9B009
MKSSQRREPGQIEKALSHPWPLGPRRPWRGTLFSSGPVPCALSLFIAVKFTLSGVFSIKKSDKSLFFFV